MTDIFDAKGGFYTKTQLIGDVNYSDTLPLSYVRTLVADTDLAVDIPVGTKLAYIYNALATPVFAALDSAITLPVTSGVGVHAMMYPPNIGVAYKMWDTPITVDTHDLHLRSASAGTVWVTFACEE